MGRLAFGLGGAVAGSFFGSTNLGFLAGSLIGGFLFPEPAQKIIGPRIEELTTSGSSYGRPIKIGYGTVPMGGDLIWVGAVRENEHRQEQSGKGMGTGPSQVQVSYTYFASCAFAFGEGVADDVLRIWFDNKLVYDKRGGTVTTKKAGLTFRFYNGSEEQLPDPTIEAEEGVGTVSAHRGICYIVFTDLELTDFGNRLPQVKAEIAYQSAADNTARTSNDYTLGEGGIFTGSASNTFAADFKRRRLYILGTSPNGIRVYNLDTLAEIRQVRYTDMDILLGQSPSQNGELMVGQDSGFIYTNVSISNSRPLIKIDPITFKEVGRVGVAAIGDTPPTSFNAIKSMIEVTAIDPVPSNGIITRRHYIVAWPTIGSDLFIFDADNMAFLYFDESFITSVRGASAAAPALGKATAWLMRQAGTGNTSLEIFRIDIETTASAAGSGGLAFGVTVEEIETLTSAIWSNDGTDGAVGPIYDSSDNSLIFMVRSATAGTYVFKWRPDDGIIWTTLVSVGLLADSGAFVPQSQVNDGLLGWIDGSNLACLINTYTGETIIDGFDYSTVTGATFTDKTVFDAATQSVIGKNGLGGAGGAVAQAFLNRAAGLGESLGAVVQNISERVGLTASSDLNITELTDTVRGYVISRQMAARDAIDPLQTAFFFDGVESDDKVVFKKRGRDPLRTITDDELIPVNSDTHDIVTETRVQEVELPERVSIIYMDINQDYLESAQSTKRSREPIPTMYSRNEASIILPIVFNADEAAQISEKVLFSAWNERISYAWQTTWEHMDLDPADVVTLHIDNQIVATDIDVRVVKALVNVDLTVSFEGLSLDKITVVSNAVGDSGSGFPQQIVPGPAFTQLFLLDIPLLRDIDNTGGSSSRLYYAMNGFQTGWPGGGLFYSVDGVNFAFTGYRSPNGVSYGICIDALPDTSTPFITDTTTQLRVVMNQGGLSSVTTDQFLNNESAALIGRPSIQNWEIILFKDAVLQADGSYIVSTLARGMRGTDSRVGTHIESEYFILLDRDAIGGYLLELSALNESRFFKGVGYGSLPEDADIEPISSTMADLKPYAPVHLDAVVDGDENIDLSWVRRDRIGGELRDGIEDIPMSEAAELYDVEILDAPGGNVIRTFSSVTTQAQQYQNIDILADFDTFVASTLLVPGDTNVDDISANAATGTLGTEAAVQTTEKVFGAGAIEFSPTATVDPSAAFVSFPDIAAYTIGTEPFTIECWVRFKDLTETQQDFASHYLNTGSQRAWIFARFGNTIAFSAWSNGSTQVVNKAEAFTFAINTWYHVAVTRDSAGAIRLFVNGVLRGGATTYSGTIHNSTEVLRLGKQRSAGSDDNPLNGYIDDFRMIVGHAAYTANFTPPTEAHPISGAGSFPSELSFRVFQISGAVGRGFGREATIVL